MAGELTRETLDRLAVSVGGKFALACTDHPKAGVVAIYQDGVVRLLCTSCGFEAARLKTPLADPTDGLVSIALDPECIHAENVGEFHPEAINAATQMLENLLTEGSRDRRDAGILAACTVGIALQTLVSETTQ